MRLRKRQARYEAKFVPEFLELDALSWLFLADYVAFSVTHSLPLKCAALVTGLEGSGRSPGLGMGPFSRARDGFCYSRGRGSRPGRETMVPRR